MSTDWSLLLEDSKSVENVKVVCKDGVVFSHKLVIASSGEFMKNLLNDVPIGDEVTIYLPDCDEDTLLNSLNSIVIPDPKGTVNVFDIASSSHQELQFKLEPEIIKTEGIFAEDRLSDQYDDITYVPLEEVLKEESENDLVKIDLQYNSESSPRDKIEKFQVDTCEFFDDTEFDNANAEHIVELQKKVIKNPKSTYEIKSNNRIVKQLKYEKAKIEVLRGTCTSERQAAKKYGVSHSILNKLIKNPFFEYQGKGKKSLVFSEAEEINLAQRIINMSDGGKTLKEIKGILIEELEHIQLNEPDRFIKVSNQNEKKITDEFVRRFVARNGLLKYVSQEFQCVSRIQSERKKCQKYYFKNTEFEDVTAEHRILEFEKQVIENPKSTYEFRFNKRIQKQIKFEKARLEVLRGTCSSVREAAKKYGVNHSFLNTLMNDPLAKYKGRGKRSRVFSEAEEINLAQRILNITDGGKNLNIKVVGEILIQEVEHIQLREPERFSKFSKQSGNKVFTDQFVREFVIRNGLLKFVSQESQFGSRRQYECDVCAAKFTFKGSMVAHRKNVHFSFLL